MGHRTGLWRFGNYGPPWPTRGRRLSRFGLGGQDPLCCCCGCWAGAAELSPPRLCPRCLIAHRSDGPYCSLQPGPTDRRFREELERNQCIHFCRALYFVPIPPRSTASHTRLPIPRRWSTSGLTVALARGGRVFFWADWGGVSSTSCATGFPGSGVGRWHVDLAGAAPHAKFRNKEYPESPKDVNLGNPWIYLNRRIYTQKCKFWAYM